MKRRELPSVAGWQAVVAAVLLLCAANAVATSYTVIYRFQGGTDGATPSAPLVADSAGNLYGTTQNGGGSRNCFQACGTVFELKPPSAPGGAWTETVIFSFTGGSSGNTPFLAPLVFDQAGNLYGTASDTVFELSPPTQGTQWTETVLYTFTGGKDGGQPNGVIFDKAGNLYGTTQTGGEYGFRGAGTVFELSPPTGKGSLWTETTLYNFQMIGDGNQPGVPVFDSEGNLYAASIGSSNSCTPKYPFQCGGIFELQAPTQKGGAWTYIPIHTFQTFTDASYPNFDQLIFDSNGDLYGTSEGTGGTGNDNVEDSEGTVFELSPTGSGAWTEAFLYSFPRPGGSDGSYPIGTPVFDPSGNLYGVTFRGAGHSEALCNYEGCGTVFELKPPSAGTQWKELQLHVFTAGTDGSSPGAGLLLVPGSALFGTTAFGGGSPACLDGCGTVFEIQP